MLLRIEPHLEPIPGYRLIERLGGGGFGEVWKAEAPGGLQKAIKFVFGDLKAAGDENQRAEQELKAMARVKAVRHPYILSLERYDIIDGQLLIVMELADRNLWDRFKECRAQGLEGIPREELMRYMEETAEALDFMSQFHQLQHLDIKPQNLFLVTDHVKVADFGLAKDLVGSHASVTGGVTPVYAAPETFDGIISRFCDQYSLAIVYQELLTGRRPFTASNVRQLILQHLQAVPDVSPLPLPDQSVIARSLSKKPNDRFPTCTDMVKLLRQNTRLGTSAPADLTVTPPSNGPATPTVADPRKARREDDVPAPPTKPGGTAPDLYEPDVSGAPEHLSPDVGMRTTHLLRGGAPASARPLGQLQPTEPFKELKGDGALFPALILSVGQTGLTAMQRLREILVERCNSLDELPNLRMLLLDTDPDAGRLATRCPSPGALTGSEIVFAGLNRPSHYLKAREGKPNVATWLNPRMLYRIPRSQVTTGMRALGRLAFWDNYRAIQRRLQTEIEACLDNNTLVRAAQQSGLGLRTNRPRVYILCGLAGGTGSGMFLDLAYTVRSLLKKQGFEQPDVVGLLFLPPAESQLTRDLALGNTHAALTELNYFGTPGARFQAQYLDQEAPLEDSNPPFSRYFLLPLAEEVDEVSNRELVDVAGQFLYRDLCTPLGRTVDLARAELHPPPWAVRGQYYQTFGLYQLTSPVQGVSRRMAHHLCQMLVRRWLNRDSKPLQAVIREQVQQKWTELGLGADQFISRLRESCQQRLGKPPESIIYQMIEPLVRRVTISPASMRLGASSVELTPDEIATVLQQIEKEIGKPKDEVTTEPPGRMVLFLKEIAEAVTIEATQRLAEFTVRLVEDPDYRLAGAEEAVRRMLNQVEQILQSHEPLTLELTTNSEQTYARIQSMIAPSHSGQRRPSASALDAVELLRYYAKNRFQSQLLHQVSGAFLSLRGHLSDELREINFCRYRLNDLLQQLENASARDPLPGVGKQLFSFGCSNLRDAVQQFLAQVTPELLQELDVRMQEMIKKKFTALVDICMGSANVLKNVEKEMLTTGQQFAEGMLGETDVAQMFLERELDGEQQLNEVKHFYDEATPELVPSKHIQPDTLTVLATPGTEAGASLQKLARSALPDVEIHSAVSADDVVVYREIVNLPLSSLPHIGQSSLVIYRQMTSTDNFTPHTRTDLPFGKINLFQQ